MEVNRELKKVLSIFYDDVEIALIIEKFHYEIEEHERRLKNER